MKSRNGPQDRNDKKPKNSFKVFILLIKYLSLLSEVHHMI